MTDQESWIKQYWRPAIAWQYLVVCLFDFMIAPTLLGLFAYLTKTNITTWTPLTLQGGGFYHMAMMSIIGISAWTRGQEKIQALMKQTEDIAK